MLSAVGLRATLRTLPNKSKTKVRDGCYPNKICYPCSVQVGVITITCNCFWVDMWTGGWSGVLKEERVELSLYSALVQASMSSIKNEERLTYPPQP